MRKGYSLKVIRMKVLVDDASGLDLVIKCTISSKSTDNKDGNGRNCGCGGNGGETYEKLKEKRTRCY